MVLQWCIWLGGIPKLYYMSYIERTIYSGNSLIFYLRYDIVQHTRHPNIRDSSSTASTASTQMFRQYAMFGVKTSTPTVARLYLPLHTLISAEANTRELQDLEHLLYSCARAAAAPLTTLLSCVFDLVRPSP